jgi:serine/threonine protein kinase
LKGYGSTVANTSVSSPDQILCPHCGKPTSTVSGFCDECGLELTSTAIKPVTAAQAMATGNVKTGVTTGGLTCPYCGSPLRPNAKHCPNCGKRVNVGAGPAATTNGQAAPADDAAQANAEPGAQGGPPTVLKPGTVIANRYGLESVLGEGGMGRAWRAYDKHLNKAVVIKTIVAQDEMLKKALQKEAETLINIRHPNIVSVIDFFTVENELCYVMEFISGPSWADEIEEVETRRLVQPMSAGEALNRVKNLLPAFKYLHGLNPPIIYCDFKPSNVKSMDLPNGERIEILLDFGTAYRYDPNVPPKPARGTPGYHSPQAAHPDWRDDYFTIGRSIAELVGMEQVHSEAYKYTLTPPDEFPWNQYDDAFRYFVEWLTARLREDRPQSVDEISTELDGVIGYVKGQKPDKLAAATARQRATANFTGVTHATMTATGTGTVKIELPAVETTNPAATIILKAQEAYEQQNLTRALQLANQAVNNSGGTSAHVLRSLIYNRIGDTKSAQADLKAAQTNADAQNQWQMALAEGQLLESTGNFAEAELRYRRMMAIKPGDYRGRLLLADLYRRSNNFPLAIQEYQAIIQSRPNVGPAYIGASRALLSSQKLDDAIHILESVSSRNASYNDVMMDLIGLYNQKALSGKPESLDQAARAIAVLQENSVESKGFYRLVADFYYTALQVARKQGKLPQIIWPGKHQPKSINELAKANERAWRDYLDRDSDADRNEIITHRILATRSWELM